MAVVNKSERKEFSSQQSVVEVTDEEDTADISSLCTEEIGECDSKGPSQNSDYNLEIGSLNSQSSTDGEIINSKLGTNYKQQLLELEDEVVRLRTENEEFKLSLAKVNEESLITILFNKSHFDCYKAKFLKFLNLFPELCINIDENHHTIRVDRDIDISSNEWIIIDEDEVQNLPSVTAIPRKKRKKDETDTPLTKQDELFIVDTTPSLSTRGQKLSYDTKFIVSNQTDSDEKPNELRSNMLLCFNCDGEHNLRECPEPRNHARINLAKQRFKMQIRTVRYHLEEDQRFTHLKPGKISEQLRHALGLRNNELPLHIYRMRQLGYPPGWLHEVQDAKSDLVVFDFEGKCDFKQKIGEKLDAEKIIEYPGFNVPMEKSTKDEYRLYGCPSYSKNVSKEKMLEHLKNLEKKAQDNLETCDMDIDSQPVEGVLNLNITQEHIGCESPTLTELEIRKQELLAELTKENSNSNLSNLEPENKMNDSKGDAYRTLDITGVVEEYEDSIIEHNKEETLCAENLSPVANVVKNSSFGTPILKSSSPYCSLPNPDNFSQNVSQVINFENLPNSTGKYDQMVGVLEKVRKTLKTLNNSKS